MRFFGQSAAWPKKFAKLKWMTLVKLKKRKYPLSRRDPRDYISWFKSILSSTIHNMPLYIIISFSKFYVIRMLIDPNTSINIMSQTTLVYLQINTSNLESNHRVLKGFNEYDEKSLGSIILSFEVGLGLLRPSFTLLMHIHLLMLC